MPNNSVEKALGVDICESGVMQNAIELWHNMYKNEPPWRGGKDNVIPLNLPAAISEEFARLILTEFSMEVTGSPMAAFINEQLKDQLTKDSEDWKNHTDSRVAVKTGEAVRSIDE